MSKVKKPDLEKAADNVRLVEKWLVRMLRDQDFKWEVEEVKAMIAKLESAIDNITEAKPK